MPGPSITVAGNLIATERNGHVYGQKQSALNDIIPLEYIMKHIGTKISRTARTIADRVLILRSSTGSGKSTTIPPELFHRYFEQTGRRNIVCTQPRALVAESLPTQIVQYHSADALREAGRSSLTPIAIGENIGYQTGPSTFRAAGHGIIFVTPGIIIRQLKTLTADEFIHKYGFIIIDEAHDRSIELDLLFFMLKRFLGAHLKDHDCPFLIVMSATFDPFAMADYLLDSLSSANLRYDNIIQVHGAVYKKERFFLEYDCVDLRKAVRERLIVIQEAGADDLVEMNQFRDVLIFVAGSPLYTMGIKLDIDKLNVEHPAFVSAPVRALYLDSKAFSSRNEDYQAIFQPYSGMNGLKVEIPGKGWRPAVRRVIVATNVAETGITLENLRYEIDTGLVFSSEFNPVVGATVGEVKSVTRGMAEQRFGRVGRKTPGFGYSLYTEETFGTMQENVYPDIIMRDISSHLLTIIIELCDPTSEARGNLREKLTDEFMRKVAKGVVDLPKLDLFTLPPADSLQYSLERLYVCGALGDNSTPTKLGFLLNAMDKISLENARTVLATVAWQVCPIDVITVAALMFGSVTPMLMADLPAAYQQWDKMSGGDDLVRLLLTYLAYQNRDNKVGGQATNCSSCHTEANQIYYNEYHDQVGACDDFSTNMAYQSGTSEYNQLGDSQLISGGKPPTIVDTFIQIDKMMEYRDSYIADMAKLGFNPFRWLGKTTHSISAAYGDNDEIVEYLRRFKLCIYEGYKLNLSEWTGTEYKVLRSGVQFMHDFVGRFVVYAIMERSHGKFAAKYVCPLDGYVNVDKEFINH